MKKPKAYTAEEARDMLLHHIASLSRYWAELPEKTALERCDGLAFSILNIFDGTTAAFPAMDITLVPHEDDKAYAIENGDRWFEPGQCINQCMLHELWYKS